MQGTTVADKGRKVGRWVNGTLNGSPGGAGGAGTRGGGADKKIECAPSVFREKGQNRAKSGGFLEVGQVGAGGAGTRGEISKIRKDVQKNRKTEKLTQWGCLRGPFNVN